MVKMSLVCALVLVLLAAGVNSAREEPSAMETLDQLLQGYDGRDLPVRDRPVRVRVGLYINSLRTVDDFNMLYKMRSYVRMAWRDPRLAFEPQHLKITVPTPMMSQIWQPDIFFRNQIEGHFHPAPSVNNEKLLRINSTGHVWFVYSISQTLSCPMKLQKFPMDTQSCPIMFESYTHTQDNILIEWLDTPVEIDTANELPQFTLQDTILYDCSQNYTAGSFPCLEARFVLRRDRGHYVLQFYLPSVLLLLLSWISFWMSPKASMERMTLLLLLLLTMAVLGITTKASMAKVSYLTALDVWIFLSVLLLVLAILEFAVVQWLAQPQEGGDEKGGEGRGGLERAKKIDKLCRLVFPVLFLLILILYWCLYAA